MLRDRTQIGRLAVVGLAMILIACTPRLPTADPTLSESQTATPAPGLEGSDWLLTLLNGEGLMAGSQITLEFARGHASGFAGCNAYSGAYHEPEPGALSIGEVAVTAQACLEPEGVMEQEAYYLEALREAATCQMTAERLEMRNEAGEVTLVYERNRHLPMNPENLIGTTWALLSLDGEGPVEGSSITLGFHDDQHASGHAGCRDYAATYEARGDEIRFPSMAMTGDESCLADEALYQQEGRYTDALSWATHYRLSVDSLEILTARGEVLVFEPGLPEGETDAEGASPDALPTNACTSPVTMVWNSHKLEDLSAQFQAALDEAGLEGAEGAAEVFGEDWYESASGGAGNQETCYFSAMQTDFYVTLRAASLADREALGRSLAKILDALGRFPPEETPGPQPGFLDVTLVAGDEHQALRVLVPEARQARARGLSGAALMEALDASPDVPGFGPACEGYQELLGTAEGVEQKAVVTSYRCENATIDSTGQSPADPPDLALGAGGQIDFRLGADEVPDSLELRLYPEAGTGASFFRWPEELPIEIEPIERVELEPDLAFEYQPKAPAGEYTLVLRAIWGEDVDVFYALSFEVR